MSITQLLGKNPAFVLANIRADVARLEAEERENFLISALVVYEAACANLSSQLHGNPVKNVHGAVINFAHLNAARAYGNAIAEGDEAEAAKVSEPAPTVLEWQMG